MLKTGKSKFLFICILALIFFALSSSGAIYADNIATQSGIEIIITTDKSVYNYDEDIIVTIQVINNSQNDAYSVIALPIVPAGLSVRPGSDISARTYSMVASGNSESFQYILYLPAGTSEGTVPNTPNQTVPETGDVNSSAIFAVLVFSVLILGTVWIARKKISKKTTRIMSVILVFIFLIGFVGNPLTNAEPRIDIEYISLEANQLITAGELPFDLGVLLDCEIHHPTVPYNITYMPNGAPGEPFVVSADTDDTLQISDCPFYLPGYVFTGWNTAPDDTGTSYSSGQALYLVQNITLYAIWQEQTPVLLSYSIFYYANSDFLGYINSPPVEQGTVITLTQEQLDAFRPSYYQSGIQVDGPVAITVENQIITVLYLPPAMSSVTVNHYLEANYGSNQYFLYDSMTISDVPVGSVISGDLLIRPFTGYIFFAAWPFNLTVSSNSAENVINIYYNRQPPM